MVQPTRALSHFAALAALASVVAGQQAAQGGSQQSSGSKQQSSGDAKDGQSAKGGSSSASKDAPKSDAGDGGKKPYVDNSWKAFTVDKLPDTWQEGQVGTNNCKKWGESSQDSMCQTAYVNNINDFCLWAPSHVAAIADTEEEEVAWCLKPGYGTRLIPEGTFTAVHFLKTPKYVQVTGNGDLTKLNIAPKDEGGELDPHGADGNGNPIGGLVFTNAYGDYQQIHEWMNFMSADEFCFRGCLGMDDQAKAQCQHIYDTMGCSWNMPGNYQPGFDSCEGEVGDPPGVYNGQTFHQGDAVTPEAHPAPPTKNCKKEDAIKYNFKGPSGQAAQPQGGAPAGGAAAATPGGSSGSAAPAAGGAAGSVGNKSTNAAAEGSKMQKKSSAASNVAAYMPSTGIVSLVAVGGCLLLGSAFLG